MPELTAPEMAVLNDHSRTLRQARAEIRRGLSTNTLHILDVLTDPPPCLADLFVLDVVRWQYQMGRTRVQLLNERAVRDNVNLLTRIGARDARVTEWIQGHLWSEGRMR